MRRYTITEYDREDYEKLEHMTCKEVIDELESLYNVLFPKNLIKYDGTEEDYVNARSSIALENAIRVITESYRCVKPDPRTEFPKPEAVNSYRNSYPRRRGNL